MSQSSFKVLLYLDDSEFSYYAALYSKILMGNMPDMKLTVVRLKEINQTSSQDGEPWQNCELISSEWMKEAVDFLKSSVNVNHQLIYCNPNIPDVVEAILKYVKKWAIQLIIIGTGELNKFKGILFGSLAYTLQIESPVPLLFVKELPQDLVKDYFPKPILKVIP